MSTNVSKEKYKCPECESEAIRFKFKVKNNDKNSAYANVTEEIQCASCFIDIPANVFVINEDSQVLKKIKQFGILFISQSILRKQHNALNALYTTGILRENFQFKILYLLIYFIKLLTPRVEGVR